MRRTLTRFGVALRKKRIERGETLVEMARDLEISPSFLSGIETGRKRVPAKLVERIIRLLDLDLLEANDLRTAAEETGPEIRISLVNRDNEARQVAAMFARHFDSGRIKNLRGALEQIEKGDVKRAKGD